jgi:tetratricopeptide (TPR) repeat protein
MVARGRIAEALDLQRHVLQSATRIYGESDPTTLSHVAAMAGVTLVAGDHAEAERLARRALMGLRIAGRGDSPRAAEAASVLARALRVAGKLDEAESPLREALRIHSLRFGASSARTLPIRAELVAVLARLGRDSEAIAGAREAADIADRAFEAESPRAAAAAHLLAWTLARCGGDLAEAERLARSAVGLVPRGPAPAEAVRWGLTLADILRRRGRLDEARSALDEAAAKIAALPEPAGAAMVVAADHLRALIEWDAGEAAEAERLLVHAAETAVAAGAGDGVWMLAACEDLAADVERFFDAAGRPQDGAAWRARLLPAR